jgi:hypothetical protein
MVFFLASRRPDSCCELVSTPVTRSECSEKDSVAGSSEQNSYIIYFLESYTLIIFWMKVLLN